MNTRGSFALAQIAILIFGIIAIGWALGSEVRTVDANNVQVTSGNQVLGIYKQSISPGSLNLIPGTGTGPANLVIDGKNAYQNFGIIGGESIVYQDIRMTDLSRVTLSSAPTITDIPIGRNSLNLQFVEPGTQTFPAETVTEGSLGLQFVEPSKETLGGRGTFGVVGTGGIGIWSHLKTGLEWSMYAVMAIQIVGRIAGMEDKAINAASAAAFGGIMAGQAITGLVESGKLGTGITEWGKGLGYASGPGELFAGATKAQYAGAAVGVIVAAIIIYQMYKTEEIETVSYTCEAWEPPTGGNMCEQCNKQSILPCSEYQCRSLGQSCELINKGTTEEKCTWVNKQDVIPPVISLWKDALSKNHRYTPDTSVSPPDTGTKIVYEQSKDGCIKAFTPLEFGIITNEPASCKLDYQRKTSFDNMSYYFGGTAAFLYNHTQVMNLPGSSALAAENITVQNNGEYSLFIRCMDSNGNKNLATFVLRFCVDKGPDTTPPLIVATNLINNMPIAYNQSTLDLEVYTNEPATCKWSHLDQNYEKLENKMTCSSSVLEMNAQMVYKCSTELNGIKSKQENNFYIKCEDQPSVIESDRNRNTESFEFTVIGTEPLVILNVAPNGTIKDSTETVKVTLEVKTMAGYEEGTSSCYYSSTQTASDYILFFNTNSYLHSQDLYLPAGEYTYYLKCVDLGGNADTDQTSFIVETDTSSPIVVRAYNEESNLKIITDEPSDCFYGINDCLYQIGDGLEMSSIDENKTQHYVSWDSSKTFYIKCQDKYLNKPYPNLCSIILRPNQAQIVE